MYEAHFGFANLPFRLEPDPRFYVDVAPHRAAIRALMDRLDGDEDFTPLIGEFGTGKSTVARQMLLEIDPARHRVGELPLMHIEGDDLLGRVTEALGMGGTAAVSPLGGVIHQLETLVRDGRGALLLVDEADRLGLDALKRLRKLTAVRVDGRAALHVYLVGRDLPAGIAQLQRAGRPLNIGAPVHVEPFDAAGTHDYILGRLARAGWTGCPAFDASTTAEIHARCHGNPGRINRLCGHILLQLFMQGRDEVNVEVVWAVDELLKSELNGESATMTLASPEPASPAADAFGSALVAVPAGADLDIEMSMAAPASNDLPALRPSDIGLAVPALEALPGARGGRPQRRLLVQAVAAIALLISGGVLWQAISDLATARSEQPLYAAVRAAVSRSTAAPTAHDTTPLRATPSTPMAQALRTPSPASPLGADVAMTAMVERAIAQSPPGAGPATPAPVAAALPIASPVAVVVPARSAEARHAARGGRDAGHRRTLLAEKGSSESTSAAATPLAPQAPGCTLEGEALGLCHRSPARRAAPVVAPGPIPDPPSADVAPSPRLSACEPARAALSLCPGGSRATP